MLRFVSQFSNIKVMMMITIMMITLSTKLEELGSVIHWRRCKLAMH